MNTILISVAAATLGWQTGYQRLQEGGMEYIIQLDSAALDALRDGRPIGSYIPADVGEVRSFRIVVGTGKPKREVPWPARPVAPPKAAEKPAPAENACAAATAAAGNALRALAASDAHALSPVCVDRCESLPRLDRLGFSAAMPRRILSAAKNANHAQ